MVEAPAGHLNGRPAPPTSGLRSRIRREAIPGHKLGELRQPPGNCSWSGPGHYGSSCSSSGGSSRSSPISTFVRGKRSRNRRTPALIAS